MLLDRRPPHRQRTPNVPGSAPSLKPGAVALHATVVGLEEWLALGLDWDALLEQSSSDRLFLSHDWQTLWWQHCDATPAETLAVVLVFQDTRLVGAAPFVIGPAISRADFTGRSAQLVGHLMGSARGMFSEYQDVIALPELAQRVRQLVVCELRDRYGCTELALSLTPTFKEWECATAAVRTFHVRPTEPRLSYQASLEAGFPAYLDGLSASSRRSIFNLRKRLHEHGDVRYAEATPEQMYDTLDALQRLHTLRWGTPPFNPTVLAFHRSLISRWHNNGRIVLSTLTVAGRCVSVQYDIRIGDRQYNLQQGFDPSFSAKLSLGTLHFGYTMEAAAAAGVRIYDFLYGNGLKTNYKNHLSTSTRELANLHLVSAGVRASMLRTLDVLRSLKRKFTVDAVPTQTSP